MNNAQHLTMCQEIIYVFIDGGYLKKAHQDTVKKLFGNHFDIDFSQIKNAVNAPGILFRLH